MTEGKGGSRKKTSKASAKSQSTKKAASSSSKAATTKPAPAEAPKSISTSAVDREPKSSSTPTVDREPTLPATSGKLGIFGGPKDRGIKPEDKLALPTGPHGVYERIRSLNPKGFYCSMRWNYHVEHLTPEEVKRWWANKKLLVTSKKNGNAVVVRAVDYGPHENTGLDIGLSPGAADLLEVEVGDEVEIAVADPKYPLGPVS
jgi:hypothetical protein